MKSPIPPVPVFLFALTFLTQMPASTAHAASCAAESGKSRVALLELYTSEGCDSCPPTDKWLSGLPQRGHTPQQVLALAFHVDYWNYLGWKDPYAQARFSSRQRDANRRIKSTVVYTPQLMLDGLDYRRGGFTDDTGRRISASNSQTPGAHISMSLQTGADQAKLRAQLSGSRGTPALAFVAVYENNLTTDVVSGENRGKRLRHDFVVRELHGPFALEAGKPLVIDQEIRRARDWKAADLNIAVFAQETASGTPLQALNLAWCGPG